MPKISGLQKQVLRPVIIMLVLMFGVAFVGAGGGLSYVMQRNLADRAERMADFLKMSTAQMLWDINIQELSRVESEVERDNEFVHVEFVGEDGNSLVENTPWQVQGAASRGETILERPVMFLDKKIGEIKLVYTQKPMIEHLTYMMAIIALALMAIGLAVLTVLRGVVLNRTASLLALNTGMNSASAKVGEDIANLSALVKNQQFSGKEIADAVGESSSSLNELNSATQAVAERLKQMVQRASSSDRMVAELSENAERIEGIVSTIVAIADSTNLLALNAAIEAARAGDSGRGFAVVADEVKKLSAQTVKQAQEVGSIVSALTASVNRVQSELGDIGGDVKDIQIAINTVADASDRQSATMAQISSTIRQFLSHFQQTEDMVTTNIGRMDELMESITKVHFSIAGDTK